MRLRRLFARIELPFWVGVGAALGGLARLLVSGLARAWGLSGELGTLFANASGSFAIGLWAALTGPDGRLLVGSRRRQFVATGLCGGYTTFSLFAFETVALWQKGAQLLALGYALSTVLGALVAVWVGHALGERLNRPRRRRRRSMGA